MKIMDIEIHKINEMWDKEDPFRHLSRVYKIINN